MKTATKPKIRTVQAKAKPKMQTKKLSKAGIAMRKGIGRGSIVELTSDPWNLHP